MKIEINFSKDEIEAFSRFCSRSTFNTFFDLTTAHFSKNQKTDEAYQMRDAVYKVLRELDKK